MKNLFFAIVFSFALLAGFAFAQYDANTCTDGTPAGTCAYEKPKYCTVGLNLEKNIDMCGCPEGMAPNIARTICITQSESSLVGDLYFISGSPFDAYSVNPIAYVENPIYKQRAGAQKSAPVVSAAAKNEVKEQAAPEAYLPKTSIIEEKEPGSMTQGQEEVEYQIPATEEVQEETAPEEVNTAQKEEQTQEAGVVDEQNMDSKEVISEQIKSVYIKEEPTPSLILQQDEKSPADEARDKLYMLVALAIIAIVAIYYWIMPKNL